MDFKEMMEQREQSQACLDSAESRQNSTFRQMRRKLRSNSYYYDSHCGDNSADGYFLHVSTSRTDTGQGNNLISHSEPQVDGILIIAVQILINAVLLNKNYFAFMEHKLVSLQQIL